MRLANLGTAGAVAAAGLFGPLVDGLNAAAPGAGYLVLFLLGALLAAVSGVAATRAGIAAPVPLAENRVVVRETNEAEVIGR